MRFWDSSGIVPLLVKEPTSSVIHQLLTEDRDMTVWWASEVECLSAFAKLERAGRIAPEQLRIAMTRLSGFAADWHEIIPARGIREGAKRLLRLHALSAADSLQLAAAIVASENHPSSLELITLDGRLRVAPPGRDSRAFFPPSCNYQTFGASMMR